MSTSQDFKTALKYNLACIFLSLRAKLKKNTLPSYTLYMISALREYNKEKFISKAVFRAVRINGYKFVY